LRISVAAILLRKILAFLGLLGVIYALALQHGVFDRAAAAPTPPEATAPSPGKEATATPTPQARRPANTRAAAKCPKAGNAGSAAGAKQKCN